MRRFVIFLFILALAPLVQAQSISRTYRADADRLINAALADSMHTWERLAYMVDTFGPRISGSGNLEQAINWSLTEMQRDGLENVHGQPVMVPHWVRGDESLEMVVPRVHKMPMLGLGSSVGTPPEGLEAEVLVVSSYDDLEAKADQAAGKIVVYNVPFTSYGQTVRYRGGGAVAAARVGAVASLVRSVGPFGMQTPHTGNSGYDDDVPKIPHAAITMEDALMLQRMQDRGTPVRLRLKMDAHFEADKPSRNVIAELRGRETPEEMVVMGCHIDSWDVGQGAMDDGGGCIAAWEALRLMHDLGMRPRRTVRVVLWTNEENGLRGGTVYRDSVMANGTLDNHVLAMETDSGVFDPIGYGFSGSDEAFAMIEEIGTLLDRIDAGTITRGGGGADIGPIMREGVPGMGLRVDGEKYFWYHHTHADTIDKLNATHIAECVATLAVMAYVVADMPTRLPR